jgi:hypothetical protein
LSLGKVAESDLELIEVLQQTEAWHRRPLPASPLARSAAGREPRLPQN